MELIEFNENIPLDTKNEYERLIKQYETLSEVQKQALISYKSFLFLFMSRIMQIEDYDKLDFETLYKKIKEHERFSRLQLLLEREFEQRNTAKNMANTPITSFIEPAFSIYKTKPDYSLKLLIQSLIPICKTLEESFECMQLEKDIVVYRGTKGEEGQEGISSSPIISTTLFDDIAFSFIDDDIDINYNLGNIYTLNVKKGTRVLVCPVGFSEGLQVKSNQFEIMFLNNSVDILVGNKERKKTFFSKGEIPLTVDCINGIVKPKERQFSDEVKQTKTR